MFLACFASIPTQSLNYKVYNDPDANGISDATNDASSKAPIGDLRSLIEKQESYIGQLEKETKFCREQLAKVLSQVQV